MRQLTAAVAMMAILAAGPMPPAWAEDSDQGLRDALADTTAGAPALPDDTVAVAADDETAIAEEDFLSDDELDELVAPVALYPDALLAQVLVAATYPLQIVEAERLLKASADLSEEELGNRLEQAEWDPSVLVLASGFPTVVQRMSDELDWTEKLGDAMLKQDDDVLSAVQRKREEARETGYLADNAAQVVETDDTGQIAIKPADPKVVYVPSYDPETVYTSRPTQPAYVAPVQNTNPIANPLVAGALAFGSALLVTELFGNGDDDKNDDGWDDYWHRQRPIDWRDRQMYPRAYYGDRGTAWGRERDRYWNPSERRWRRDSRTARRSYAAERRDALGWLVVDDPTSRKQTVRAFRHDGRWFDDDAATRRAAQQAAERRQARAEADRRDHRRREIEERRADRRAAERREARLKAEAISRQEKAAAARRDTAAAKAAADARAKMIADAKAKAAAKEKARAAARKQAAADKAATAKRRDAAADRTKAKAAQRRDAGAERTRAEKAAAAKRRAAAAERTKAAGAAKADARAGPKRAADANTDKAKAGQRQEAEAAAAQKKAKAAAAQQRERKAGVAERQRKANAAAEQERKTKAAARQQQQAKAAAEQKAKAIAEQKQRAKAAAEQQQKATAAQQQKAKAVAEQKQKAAAAQQQKAEGRG